MAGYVLTSATLATCPHGGQVSFVASQQKVKADSAAVLLSSDTATIAGCPFMVGTVASPCLSIQWSAPATKVTVTGTAVLLTTSIGLCLSPASAPQGSLIVSQCQSKVQAT